MLIINIISHHPVKKFHYVAPGLVVKYLNSIFTTIKKITFNQTN
jgi:hypothetical protein